MMRPDRLASFCAAPVDQGRPLLPTVASRPGRSRAGVDCIVRYQLTVVQHVVGQEDTVEPGITVEAHP